MINFKLKKLLQYVNLIYLALLQERQKDYNRLNESLMIKVRKYEQVLLAKGKESQEQISISNQYE